MARLPRISVSGMTQHVVQRGNNHLPCFFSADDHDLYIDFLEDAIEKHDVALHAYCLMSNHVHLLMTAINVDGISRALQDLGRRYVRSINNKYGRTGTLWEGRYHSCLVEDGQYILDCYRYIETNPVRNGIVIKAEDYSWSSFHCNALNKSDCVVKPHTEYLRLAANPTAQRDRYFELVKQDLSEYQLKSIREATQSNRIYGSDNFIYWIEKELSIRVRKKKAGRPRKQIAKV